MYEFVHNLTWTHIRRLLSVTNEVARKWYLENASRDMWSTTTLDRYFDYEAFGRDLFMYDYQMGANNNVFRVI